MPIEKVESSIIWKPNALSTKMVNDKSEIYAFYGISREG
jgi:hypothetical protein